jgi:hypothetical protein
MIKHLTARVLSLILGGLIKVYDDLNDNDLYTLYKIPYRKYIDEFLKYFICQVVLFLFLKNIVLEAVFKISS